MVSFPFTHYTMRQPAVYRISEHDVLLEFSNELPACSDEFAGTAVIAKRRSVVRSSF